MVTAFAHGAMGHWSNPSWWTRWAISHSSQCPSTGVTKAVVCVSCLWDDAYKRTLAANHRVAYVVAAGFLFPYQNGP